MRITRNKALILTFLFLLIVLVIRLNSPNDSDHHTRNQKHKHNYNHNHNHNHNHTLKEHYSDQRFQKHVPRLIDDPTDVTPIAIVKISANANKNVYDEANQPDPPNACVLPEKITYWHQTKPNQLIPGNNHLNCQAIADAYGVIPHCKISNKNCIDDWKYSQPDASTNEIWNKGGCSGLYMSCDAAAQAYYIYHNNSSLNDFINPGKPDTRKNLYLFIPDPINKNDAKVIYNLWNTQGCEISCQDLSNMFLAHPCNASDVLPKESLDVWNKLKCSTVPTCDAMHKIKQAQSTTDLKDSYLKRFWLEQGC
jgi:hypothetical protein